MAKRRAVASPEREYLRGGGPGKAAMDQPADDGVGRRTPQPHRIVELSDAWLVGNDEEYYTKPYLRTAPLFIHDLQDHNLWEWRDLMDDIRFSSDSCSTEFPEEHRDLFKNVNVPNVAATKHILVEIKGQTRLPETGCRVVSTVCVCCLHHFVLKVDPGPTEPVCRYWGASMFHELEHCGDEQRRYVEDSSLEYYPPVAKATYRCCNEHCQLKVEVEVSEPRVPYGKIKLLLNEGRIYRRLERAMMESPDRYEGVDTTVWASDAIDLLRRYLVDVNSRNTRTGKPGPIRFSKRVKRFDVVFGPEFYDLFRALGYKEETVDGEDFFVQSLPRPAEPGVPTVIGTYRAFVEDAIEEVKIHELRRRLVLSSMDRHEGEACARNLGLVPALASLEAALDCAGRPSVGPNGALNYHLRFLGVMPDMTAEAVMGAMNRRVRMLPEHDDAMQDSLYTLARDRSGHLGQDGSFFSLARDVGVDRGDERNALWNLYPSGVRRTEDEVFTHFVRNMRVLDAHLVDSRFAAMLEYLSDRAGTTEIRRKEGCRRLRFRLLGWQQGRDPSLPGNPMLAEVARAVLKVNEGDSMEDIKAKIRVQSEHLKSNTLVAAVEAIGSHHPELGISTLATEMAAEAQRQKEEKRRQEEAEAQLRPVGLRNIGNTCYLNSILQYFYTINSVRALVERYHENKLEEKDMESRRIGGTKSKVRELDLITGQYLTGDALPTLFTEMRTAPRGPCAPSQGLANVVLLTHRDLMTLTKSGPASTSNGDEKIDSDNLGQFPEPPSQNAPPLPARPADPDLDSNSPGTARAPSASTDSTMRTPADSGLPSPMSSSATLTGDAVDGDILMNQAAGSLNSDASMLSASGSAPSMKDADGDVAMHGSESQAAVPPEKTDEARVDSEAIRLALPKKHDFPMNQQDVDEIMGRIIGLMQAAIKPDDVRGDVQMEEIMRTFFFNVTRARITYNEDGTIAQTSATTESARNLMAFPGDSGSRTLYEALEQEYGRETIKEKDDKDSTTVVQHSSLRNPPPILHVLIQRTKQDGQKNTNVVEITEFLDLDRYMDAPDDSTLMAMREKTWESKRLEEKLTKILRTLEQDKLSARIVPVDRIQNPVDYEVEAKYRQYAVALMAQLPNVKGVREAAKLLRQIFYEDENESASRLATVLEDTVMSGGESEAGTMSEDEQANLLLALTANINEAMEINKVKRQTLFDGMSDQRYALHAVVCHSGSGKGGHYWVWIRDFTTGEWRRYNDENTNEVRKDTDSLLTELNKTDHPYFICYVRDSEKENLVRVPTREPGPEAGQA